MDETRQIAVIGAGPGGMAAAIYLQRAGLNPLVLEKEAPGGLLLSANLVENYPGFPGGITGRELAARFIDQLNILGISVTQANVREVGSVDKTFNIETDIGSYASRAVIIATGTLPRKVKIRGASALEGNRVLYGIESMRSSDGGNGRIIVVGGGDVAFDYALNLSDRGHNVTIVARSTVKCLSLLRERAEEKGIAVLIDHLPEQVFEERGSAVLVCNCRGEVKRIRGDRILIACGRVPNLELLSSGLLKSIRNGKALPDTGTSGLFLVGDVARKRYRQTGIAVGDGIIAAMHAERYLARTRRRA